MKIFFGLFIVAVFLMASTADAVEIYTFKKDRVDQNLDKGNRGYLTGQPAAGPERTGTRQRTLIGIDIEIPEFGAEASEDEEAEAQLRKTPAPEKKMPAVKERIVEEEVFTEEEWIK